MGLLFLVSALFCFFSPALSLSSLPIGFHFVFPHCELGLRLAGDSRVPVSFVSPLFDFPLVAGFVLCDFRFVFSL